MATLTVREIDEGLLLLLRALASRRNQSMDRFVRELLEHAVGYEPALSTYNDLDAIAGAWNEEDQRGFDQETRRFSEIDPDLWA